MKNKKNFFTYLCYTLFVLCTLIYIAAYIGVFDTFVITPAVTGIIFAGAVMLIALLACYILSVIFHGRKKTINPDYLNTEHKRYEYVIETIAMVVMFAAALAFRIFLKYKGVFTKDTFIFEQGFMLNNLFSLTGTLFMYLSIRFAAGRLASFIATALMLFWPSEVIAVYIDTTTGLITGTILWGLFLWFILFFKGYTKSKTVGRKTYIWIILLGIASNLVLFASEYAFLIILSVFAFMLFKYWKPALLYILFSMPAVCLKIIYIITGINEGKTDEFYDLLNFNITVSDINLLKFSNAFFDVNTLIYLTLYIFALAAVIVMFKKGKKPFQILMLYAVFAAFLGRENFLFIISVYIMLAAYMVQIMYSFIVKKRCLKYCRISDNESAAVEDGTEDEFEYTIEDENESEDEDAMEDENESEYAIETDMYSETDILDIIPKYVADKDYTINTNEDYKSKLDYKTLEMLERRKNRILKDSDKNNNID